MEEPKKTNCEVCFRRGETKRAAVICRECRIRYCADCREDHSADDIYKDHVIDEFTSAFITTERESSDEEEQYHNDFDEEVFTKPFKAVTVKLVQDFTDCQIRAVCPMSDDRIMVADSANMTLKMFDKNFTLTTAASVPVDFSCLALIDNETAISVWQKTLYYWNVQPFECLQIRKVDLKNVGYAVHSNGLAVAVLESSDNFLEIFDFDGNQTDSIDLASICYGKAGYAITLDSTGQRFYVSNRDYDNGTKLLCVAFTGQIMWTCPISASVGGIMEYGDHILAVSVGYSRIHRVSRDGQDAGVFVRDIGHLPFSFCMQPKSKRIVVSHNNLGRDRNVLNVFNII